MPELPYRLQMGSTTTPEQTRSYTRTYENECCEQPIHQDPWRGDITYIRHRQGRQLAGDTTIHVRHQRLKPILPQQKRLRRPRHDL